jgi:hypothetical protein
MKKPDHLPYITYASYDTSFIQSTHTPLPPENTAKIVLLSLPHVACSIEREE